jgi:hypothetical protein
MKKKYTLLQMERRLRANDRGAKMSLAADLRKAAGIFEKGRELTKEEAQYLSDIPPLVKLAILTDRMTKETLPKRKV